MKFIRLKGESGWFWVQPDAVQVVEVASDFSIVVTSQRTLAVRTDDNTEALRELLGCDELPALIESITEEWQPPF